DKLAAFSTRGEWVKVMAPGVGILSTVPPDPSAPGVRYGVWGGTSMAAPFVAGQAALVRAQAPALTPAQVNTRVVTTGAQTPAEPVRSRADVAASVVPFDTSATNPIDATPDFVRQNYLDFLNRAPDAGGLGFWSKGINDCGASAGCVSFNRANTSAAFFLSIEFQQTGYFVYRLNKAAYGDLAGRPVPVRYEEFMPDTLSIGEGVVVGTAGWEGRLRQNRAAFAAGFVARDRFRAAYPADMTADDFVDKLAANAGVTLAANERADLLALLAPGQADAARAAVLQRLADHPALVAQEFRKAFVLMQYFGYLRRNPDDGGNRNFGGYFFWLKKLEENGGDFHKAEMVRAFIESIEYRQRFGQ
ncbi:MAG TPA: S8 family serine peptidase, partial [Pyrinomonadaceae bacterium]|nr:S8 family serine peptidase [Pyrinomonadaceae bacterium]